MARHARAAAVPAVRSVHPDVLLAFLRKLSKAQIAHQEAALAVREIKKAGAASGINLKAHALNEHIRKLRKRDLRAAEALLVDARQYALWEGDPTFPMETTSETPSDAPVPTASAVIEFADEKASDEGFFAGRDGLAREVNPHEAGSSAFDRWDRSWVTASTARSLSGAGTSNADQTRKRRPPRDTEERATPW